MKKLLSREMPHRPVSWGPHGLERKKRRKGSLGGDEQLTLGHIIKENIIATSTA